MEKRNLMKKNPTKNGFLSSYFLCFTEGHWMAFSEHYKMCISSKFKARIGVVFTLSVSIQGILGCFLCRDFPPRPAFLCVLHCSSTRSLQLLPHLLCKSRTPHPQEWGICPPTGTGDSLWELQGKERAAFCFYFLLSGTGAAGPALLVLFHHGQSQYHMVL